ncbi:MAG: Retroviral aspartyl protease [Nitrososphaeria archaeon]|nr:Retroviral aspartyl protease [Nitrososphaeria archaeon]
MGVIDGLNDGTFKVKAKVWNPSKLSNVLDVELIVDAGATYTVLPAKMLEELDIEVVRTARLRLADNRVIERPLDEIGIEIEKHKAGATPIVFREENVYLLGAVTMEQLGLAQTPKYGNNRCNQS